MMSRRTAVLFLIIALAATVSSQSSSGASSGPVGTPSPTPAPTPLPSTPAPTAAPRPADTAGLYLLRSTLNTLTGQCALHGTLITCFQVHLVACVATLTDPAMVSVYVYSEPVRQETNMTFSIFTAPGSGVTDVPATQQLLRSYGGNKCAANALTKMEEVQLQVPTPAPPSTDVNYPVIIGVALVLVAMFVAFIYAVVRQRSTIIKSTQTFDLLEKLENEAEDDLRARAADREANNTSMAPGESFAQGTTEDGREMGPVSNNSRGTNGYAHLSHTDGEEQEEEEYEEDYEEEGITTGNRSLLSSAPPDSVDTPAVVPMEAVRPPAALLPAHAAPVDTAADPREEDQAQADTYVPPAVPSPTGADTPLPAAATPAASPAASPKPEAPPRRPPGAAATPLPETATDQPSVESSAPATDGPAPADTQDTHQQDPQGTAATESAPPAAVPPKAPADARRASLTPSAEIDMNDV